MKLSLRHIFLSLFILLSSISPTLAFQLLPISRVFEPAGSGATQSYQVVNDGKEPVAVEISLTDRKVDLDGKESNKKADDDFLVYPPQMVIPPGKTQIVRVTWMGNPNPEKELAYRLIATQLPINLEKPQPQDTARGQVKLAYRYIGSVYIRPKKVQHKVVLDNITHQKAPDGSDQLAITFDNQGTGRAVLGNLQLTLSTTGQAAKVELKPEQLANINNSLILPGSKRRFVMAWPKGLPVGPVTGTFTFQHLD